MATTTTTTPTIDTADLAACQSISHGTLRPDHLADALLGEIDRLGLSEDLPTDLAVDLQRLAAYASEPVADLPDSLLEIDPVSDAVDWLNDHAPNGWAVGFSEADGSDLCWQPVSLRAKLQAVGSRWVATGWEAPKNEAIDDIIDCFDDCPEALQDFDHSDWVNLAECYTRDLLHRWDQQSDDIKALFDSYCEAIGATSALEALEGQTIEDPDDMTAAMVNTAMTWGARMLLDEIKRDL